MSADNHDPIPEEAQLAIAHSPARLRIPLTIFLELDARIARIIAATNEPMLGQMRLAWWRDTLKQPAGERPQGDRVLDAIGQYWSGQETALIALIDGWEEMLGEVLTSQAAERFAAGRAAPFAALPSLAGLTVDHQPALYAAQRWALVDAALHVSEGSERSTLIELAQSVEASAALPRAYRGLAVLNALAERSLKRGVRPLMEGRGAALTALRAAMLGR